MQVLTKLCRFTSVVCYLANCHADTLSSCRPRYVDANTGHTEVTSNVELTSNVIM